MISLSDVSTSSLIQTGVLLVTFVWGYARMSARVDNLNDVINKNGLAKKAEDNSRSVISLTTRCIEREKTSVAMNDKLRHIEDKVDKILLKLHE